MEFNSNHRSENSLNTLDILSSRSTHNKNFQFESTERSNTLWNFSHQSEIQSNQKKKQCIQGKQIKKTIVYYSSEQRYRVYDKIQKYTSLINRVNIKHWKNLKKQTLIKIRQIVQKQSSGETGYIQLVYEQLFVKEDFAKVGEYSINKAELIKGQTQLVNLIKDVSLQNIIVKFFKQNCYFATTQPQNLLNLKYYLPIQDFNHVQDQQLIIRNAINFALLASNFIQSICLSMINNKDSLLKKLDQLPQRNNFLQIQKERLPRQLDSDYPKQNSLHNQATEKSSCFASKDVYEDTHSTKHSTVQDFKITDYDKRNKHFEESIRQSYLSANVVSQLNLYSNYDNNKLLRIASTQKIEKKSLCLKESQKQQKDQSDKNFRTKKIKGNNREDINRFRQRCRQLRNSLSARKY